MLKVKLSDDVPSNFDHDLFKNKWKYRQIYKFNLIENMEDGIEKDKELVKFCWSI